MGCAVADDREIAERRKLVVEQVGRTVNVVVWASGLQITKITYLGIAAWFAGMDSMEPISTGGATCSWQARTETWGNSSAGMAT